jgi:hypothetical protein
MEREIMIATLVNARTLAPHPPVDYDTRAALSLARASTAALLSLSALARREMITALTDEVALLHSAEDEPSLHAARVLAAFLPADIEQDARDQKRFRSESRHKFKV